jgi:hypothetical protein
LRYWNCELKAVEALSRISPITCESCQYLFPH